MKEFSFLKKDKINYGVKSSFEREKAKKHVLKNHYFPDFYIPSFNLIVECKKNHHHLNSFIKIEYIKYKINRLI